MDRNEILKIVKEKIIFDGLKLEDLGYTLDDVTNDVRLFGENSLDLSSVDVLEILMLIKREFKIEIDNINREEVEKHFTTPSDITDYIVEHLPKNK